MKKKLLQFIRMNHSEFHLYVGTIQVDGGWRAGSSGNARDDSVFPSSSSTKDRRTHFIMSLICRQLDWIKMHHLIEVFRKIH